LRIDQVSGDSFEKWGRKLSASREFDEVILGLLVVGKEGKRGSMIY
jgi:hypothetical protein